eukprot:TRINITY_DN318_c0_g1_i10.p1 TRINITY_DN318_c0_g1~~TRINITY_DN318_c0_g1_i10.p1  ORF type:complete len:901 (-),score=232.80 TRINITY_DN318_c0_g1_i10:591-3242(-)
MASAKQQPVNVDAPKEVPGAKATSQLIAEKKDDTSKASAKPSSAKPESKAASSAKPKAEAVVAAAEAPVPKRATPPAAKAVAQPVAPAAKAAASAESPAEKASRGAPKVAVKPATELGKAVLGLPTDEKKPAAAASESAPSATSGKASALVGGGAVAAKAKAAPKAATPSVPPTSAAAVMTEGVKPVTAMERQSVIGSVLSRGPGAKAEPAAKPKAKAKAGVSAPTPSLGSSAAYPSKASTAPSVVSAPASVVDIVSGTPQPALESTANAPPAQSPPNPSGSAVGPAKAFAKLAASVIGAVAGTPDAAGKPIELPKEGPAAVAAGRAVASGAASPIKVANKPKVSIGKKYQIVFVAGEAAPYSKTGGLGEAMDGLPIALAALGHRVMVISPRYDQYKDAWDTDFWSTVTMGGKKESVHFFHAYKQKVDKVFVDHPCFLERVNGLSGSKLYGPEWGKDFADNQARFAYFCKAALVAIKDLPLAGYPYGDNVVVVANDWHSALVPMFIDAQRNADPSQWKSTKTAFLCHNAVFQGRFELEQGLAHVLDVPQKYVDSITFKMPLKVGKYNKKTMCVNTMAAGLRYSDRVITVSPSYATECAVDPEKGVELEELFALGRVTGILNGVKEGVSPAEKNFVTKTSISCGTFSPATVAAAKAELKASYFKESGLPASEGPLMCFIGRLDAQKGYDLLLEALTEVLEDTEMQVVIVGAGRADLVQMTKALEKKFPSKFHYAGWMGPERYALLAACEYTLLPSRWEPCGLVQMEAMRMGTLPIVAPTGGLKDTVEDEVNGLWTDAEMTVEAELDDDSIDSIAKALRRASEIHMNSPAQEVRMMQAAMSTASEFTWSNAALQYEAVFEELGVKDVLGTCLDRTVTLEADKQVC